MLKELSNLNQVLENFKTRLTDRKDLKIYSELEINQLSSEYTLRITFSKVKPIEYIFYNDNETMNLLIDFFNESVQEKYNHLNRINIHPTIVEIDEQFFILKSSITYTFNPNKTIDSKIDFNKIDVYNLFKKIHNILLEFVDDSIKDPVFDVQLILELDKKDNSIIDITVLFYSESENSVHRLTYDLWEFFDEFGNSVLYMNNSIDIEYDDSQEDESTETNFVSEKDNEKEDENEDINNELFDDDYDEFTHEKLIYKNSIKIVLKLFDFIDLDIWNLPLDFFKE